MTRGSMNSRNAEPNHRPIEKTQRLLYHVPDAAFQLSISTAEIWRRIAAGDLRPTRVGKRVLVSHAECLRFIEANTLVAAGAYQSVAQTRQAIGVDQRATQLMRGAQR